MMRSSIVLVVCAACAGAAPGSPRSVPHTAASHRAPDLTACASAVDGLAPVLASYRVVAFAEVHGTNEIPRLVGDVACATATAGREVVIAIEHDAAQQDAIDHAVATGDPAPLLATELWSHEIQDGRASRAMLELVLRAHELRARDLRVSVLAIDGGRTWPERDPHMADALERAATEHPGALIVALTGMSHAWKRAGSPFVPSHRSAVQRLVERGVPVYAIAIRQSDYVAWLCVPAEKMEPGKPYTGGLTCGPQRKGDPARTVARRVLASFVDHPAPPGDPTELSYPAGAFDAELDLGALSVSPPARGTGRGTP